MKKQKLIFISGKMGEKKLSRKTIEKFEKAQNDLLEQGYAVMNPASQKFQEESHEEVSIEEEEWVNSGYGKFDWYSWLLLWDLHMLTVCDGIYMLKDWKESPGATAEHAYAMACKKKILYEEENG